MEFILDPAWLEEVEGPVEKSQIVGEVELKPAPGGILQIRD
jgi:hypothetical protein